MKRIDLFCSSPASTKICSSLDHRSVVRHGTRPIDHHLHNSRHSYFDQNIRKSTSSSKHSDFRRKSSADKYSAANNKQNDNNLRRKNSADINDVVRSSSTSYLLSENVAYIDWISESEGLVLNPDNRRLTKTEHTRLNDAAPARRSCSLAYYGTTHDHMISENDRDSALVSCHSTNSRFSRSSNVSPVASKSSSSAQSRYQVVDLWVSIHCKGCEGKVRKHISKMEGVRSFSIDLATKKVRVIGNVTPLGVLASVSKVKNAQLWPSTTPSPSRP